MTRLTPEPLAFGTNHKTLLILGAGPDQLPLIRRGIELGYRIATVDPFPHNIGHRYAHRAILRDVRSADALLALAQRLGIEGLAPISALTARVAQQLHLPGPNAKAVEIMTDRAQLRAFQQARGFAVPRFVCGSSWEQVQPHLEALTGPLVFKPTRPTAPGGTIKADRTLPHHLANAFYRAQQASLRAEVCVEEYVGGHDLWGAAFLRHGAVELFALGYKHKHGIALRGCYLPAHMPPSYGHMARREIAATCQALGYSDGPVNFDVRLSRDSATVISLRPDLGTGGLPSLLERHTEIDWLSAMVRLAAGDEPQWPTSPQATYPCGSCLLTSSQAGKLKRFVSSPQLRAAIPEIFEYSLYYRPGQTVPRFGHRGHALGHALFDCAPNTYARLLERIEANQMLELEHPFTAPAETI